jgi:hypothetical protein
MDIDPDRILIVAGRHCAQVESDRVKRVVDAAVVPDAFQNAMDDPNDLLIVIATDRLTARDLVEAITLPYFGVSL